MEKSEEAAFAKYVRKMKQEMFSGPVNSLVKTRAGCCCISTVITLFAITVVFLFAGLNHSNMEIEIDTYEESHQVMPSDVSREVNQPFCEIFSVKTPKNDRLDGALCNPRRQRTSVMELSDGNTVLSKVIGSKCMTCCFKKIVLVDNHFRRTKQCFPISTIRVFSTTEIAMLQTFCTNECNKSGVKKNLQKTSTALHALFPVTTQVTQKMKFWNHRKKKLETEYPNSKKESKITRMILLNIENLSRQQARLYLPQTLGILKEFGFIEMKGFSQVSADPATNTIASLTGLKAKEWDLACSYSKHRHLDQCPFIWKLLDASHYITSYIQDTSIFNSAKPGNNQTLRDFEMSPADYFLEHGLYKSMINQTSANCRYSDSIKTLLEFSSRINQKFLDYPFFSFTRIGSVNYSRAEYDLDYKLKNFLLTLKSSLKQSLVVVYSNYGFRMSMNKQPGGISNTFEPILFMSLPEHLKGDFARNLMLNAGRLTTMFDLYRTLDHVARLSHIELGKTDSIKTDEFKKRRIGSSLLNLVSTQRNCQDAHISEESCPCNLNPISGKYNLTMKVRTDISEEVLGKLNSLIPNKNLCTTFALKWLDNIIPIRNSAEQLDVLVQYRVGVKSEVYNRKEMSLEQRIRIDQKSLKLEAIGMPVWTAKSEGNDNKCLQFVDAFYMEKQFCVCKSPENLLVGVGQP